MAYKDIKELGTYPDRTAVLIGNGNSVNRCNFGAFTDINCVYFGINSFKPIECDYIIHYDNNIYGQSCAEYYKDKGKTRILSFALNAHSQTDFIYHSDDFIFADSGFHLLQIVSNILKFKRIFLVGYDYCPDGKKLRWNDNENTNLPDFDTYNKIIFVKALNKYKRPRCQCTLEAIKNCRCKEENIFRCAEIYNTNSNSALRIFNFSDIGGINV